ncbi:MAG TPA: sigma-70 family RNA polymerase sigma factor [Gemmatales bacterium]|nr:sigma-70 family RNA polymerase sigma factor [Gemmatales bacterium]
MSTDPTNFDQNHFHHLLHQARQGDALAREELFTLSRPYLSQVAEHEIASWLRPKHDASDLVQVSLLEAHQAFQTFQGEEFPQWLTFLRRILERNATDAVRHYGTAKRQTDKERALHPQNPDASSLGGPVLAAPGETPSMQAIRQENSKALMRAIEQLPLDYQEVIRLRNLEQLAFDEVAQRMQRSRPAVQMLWMRAIKNLEALMRQDNSSTFGG